MKKFFVYFAAAILLLSFNSCSEESSLKKVLPVPTPSMNWGAAERTIEKEMKELGYRLEDEESGKSESALIFSYDHGKYEVECIFLYSEYCSFGIYGLKKTDCNDLVDWLDKHYTEEAYKRYGDGLSYFYKSKDDKSWVYVGIWDDDRNEVEWGSMKYAADSYEEILDKMRR